ncbi:MAG: 2-amino-4-hydroxy-6-hydroxymethyldihydropteridine diphosphokinase [bacterium]|jgi:2-amino-4-hydroxy-6-hydroxymethyldihydropteridine diphosphokinase
MSSFVYLSFGSNIGDREANLNHAVAAVESIEGFDFVTASSIYISEAVAMDKSAPEFLNMVVKGEYQYRPLELLNALELIEKKLGRTGKGEMLPRSIDIDILLFGEEVVETERLSIPHRHLTERPFILIPLLQLEPTLIHPVSRKPLAVYLKERDRRKILMYKETPTRHA